MALFRFQRGSLEESLKTTIIVRDINDLLEKLAQWYEKEGSGGMVSRSSMYQWQCHIHQEQKFDERCGWYSHLVSFQVRNSEFFAVGFISEPLDDYKARS